MILYLELIVEPLIHILFFYFQPTVLLLSLACLQSTSLTTSNQFVTKISEKYVAIVFSVFSLLWNIIISILFILEFNIILVPFCCNSFSTTKKYCMYHSSRYAHRNVPVKCFTIYYISCIGKLMYFLGFSFHLSLHFYPMHAPVFADTNHS